MLFIEPESLYRNAEFESIAGESEPVCYHAVRDASTSAILANTLPAEGERTA